MEEPGRSQAQAATGSAIATGSGAESELFQVDADSELLPLAADVSQPSQVPNVNMAEAQVEYRDHHGNNDPSEIEPLIRPLPPAPAMIMNLELRPQVQESGDSATGSAAQAAHWQNRGTFCFEFRLRHTQRTVRTGRLGASGPRLGPHWQEATFHLQKLRRDRAHSEDV